MAAAIGIRAAVAMFGSLMAGAAMAGEPVEVLKTESCGCCGAWVDHLKAAGTFDVEVVNVEYADLVAKKIAAGLSPELAACHTAHVGGYVVEGHVPAREIERLLAERPDAIGLAVPGMPLGSPGMESGADTEPYDVLLVNRDGSTEVFATYR